MLGDELNPNIKLKSEIRKECIRKRDAIPESERLLLSDRIAERLLSYPLIQSAERILLYSAIRSEVSTTSLMTKLYESGVKLYLPFIETGDANFIPAEYAPGDPLVFGAFKVMQPRNFKIADPKCIDLTIAPGVAFDSQGGRIGYGKGFYDRFLNRTRPDSRAIGIAFEIQVIERIPVEPHDRILDALVTETQIREFHRS